MTRRDYGPQGAMSAKPTRQGRLAFASVRCARRSAALMGAMGLGAFMFSLMGKLTFHVTTWGLRKLEDRRDSAR